MAATGETFGVRGVSDSESGCGVYGEATADPVLGDLDLAHITNGVMGIHHGPNGAGVYGETDSRGHTMLFTTTTVAGVEGRTTATSGKSYGVMGISDNPYGAAVHGFNTTSGPGLTGVSTYGNPIEAYDYEPGTFGGSHELVFYVNSSGNVYADGVYTSPAQDFAEMLPSADGLEPGDVLVVGENGELVRSTEPGQSSVVGVYSTKPGFLGGSRGEETATGRAPLAIMGIVPVKAVNGGGPIRPGDLLVTSSVAGHAMKAGEVPKIGTVIGKALEGLDGESGMIRMLVMLQ
jgi:hypothetical protein